jgi:hypothetical protein
MSRLVLDADFHLAHVRARGFGDRISWFPVQAMRCSAALKLKAA